MPHLVGICRFAAAGLRLPSQARCDSETSRSTRGATRPVERLAMDVSLREHPCAVNPPGSLAGRTLPPMQLCGVRPLTLRLAIPPGSRTASRRRGAHQFSSHSRIRGGSKATPQVLGRRGSACRACGHRARSRARPGFAASRCREAGCISDDFPTHRDFRGAHHHALEAHREPQ